MEQVRIRFLAGVFFISSATLCLEICFIRYFSVSQHYHFAFLVVSFAFLGFGASGSFLTVSRRLLDTDREKFLSTTSLLFSISLLLSFLLGNSLPFDFAKLAWDGSQLWLIAVYYILFGLPFFFAGLSISFAVSRAAQAINRVYFADLCGAGAGTVLALFIFLPWGDKGVIPIILLLGLLASVMFQRRTSAMFVILALSLAAGLSLILFLSPSWLSFRISSYKALPLALKYPGAEHLLTKWNAISRIDLIRSPAVRFAPGLSLLHTLPLPPQLGLTVDGDGLTAVTQTEGSPETDYSFLSALPSSFGYTLFSRPSVLILEPKGSLDVLAAYVHKARLIKVVESNPLLVDILRKELGHFTSGLYKTKNIQVETSHARTALNREQKEFDLIFFPLTDVFGSSSTGMYGLGEDYLHTIECFAEAFSHLSGEGMVAMSFYLLPPPRKEIRALATWVETLERMGKDPSDHVAALRSWGTISLFVKKNPFTPLEIEALKSFAETHLFDLVHYPKIKKEEVNIHNRFKEPLYHDFFVRILDKAERKELFDSYLFQIEPATDNRPFFNNLYKFSRLKKTFQSLGQKWLPLVQGEFVVPLLLVVSAFFAFVLILAPFLQKKKNRNIKKGISLRIFFYFSLIGLAYIFLEITLIQKFILFLGHPLFSASLVIASLLVSSGMGSLGSKLILGENFKKNLLWTLLLCACLILLYSFLLPLLFQTALKVGFALKILLTVLVIFPVGFVMGFPFPTGIRILKSVEKDLIPWAWAINAFSSVINSVMALLIAFWGGYSLVLILSSGGYLLTIPILNGMRQRQTKLS